MLEMRQCAVSARFRGKLFTFRRAVWGDIFGIFSSRNAAAFNPIYRRAGG